MEQYKKNEALDKIIEFFNLICTGYILNDWLASNFIVKSETTTAKICSEYTTMVFLSHLLKIVLKIIHNGIYKTFLDSLNGYQQLLYLEYHLNTEWNNKYEIKTRLE